MTTKEQWDAHLDKIFGKRPDPTEIRNIGQPGYEEGNTEVEDYVKANWPDAIHEGVGHWRIPRKAHIHYSGNNSDANGWYATLTVIPMGGRRD